MLRSKLTFTFSSTLDYCQFCGKLSHRQYKDVSPIGALCEQCAREHAVAESDQVYVRPLCEAPHLVAVPGRLYRFTVIAGCAKCEAAEKQATDRGFVAPPLTTY